MQFFVSCKINYKTLYYNDIINGPLNQYLYNISYLSDVPKNQCWYMIYQYFLISTSGWGLLKCGSHIKSIKTQWIYINHKANCILCNKIRLHNHSFITLKSLHLRQSEGIKRCQLSLTGYQIVPFFGIDLSLHCSWLCHNIRCI